MTYTLEDFKQATIGSFIAVIVFFAIRGGNPFSFDPYIGLGITGVLLWIYYNGFKMKYKMQHFVINLLIAFTVCSLMALVFGLITKPEILTFNIFGTLVIVGVWIAFPLSLVFDRFNFTNPLRRFYVRGQ